MKRYLAPAACAAAILISSVSVDAILAPAAAQQDVDFDSFHDYLANYGDWVYSDRWGEVWVPENVPDDFQPYGTNGYWAASDDYGWIWVSNYEWGDVPFHYGRWVNDPDIGWLWIPGYVWSPAWVVWRHNGDYVGWMPMPPDREFLGQGSGPSGGPFGISLGLGISLGHGLRIGINFNDTSRYYGYSQWYPGYDENRFARNWVFIPTRHLADRDFHRYWAPRGNNVSIIRNTTNITNYTVVNNYVVNRGIDVKVVERAGGHPVEHVRLEQVIRHPQFVAKADAGMQIQTRMRREMPRGNGETGSAPAPSQKVVQGLSDKTPQHEGHAPMHVFTKQTVTQAPSFKGKMPGGEAGAMHGPGGSMSGPGGGANNGPGMMHEHKPAEPGGAMSGPTGAMTGGTQNKPADTGGESGGKMMHKHENAGGGAPMNAPNGAMGMQNKPAETGGESSGGMMMHKHDATGGAMMQGPANAPEHHAPQTGGEGASPMMMHRHDSAGGGNEGSGGRAMGGEAIGAGGPMHNMEKKPPVTTPPAEHAATPPADHPPKGEDKDKKDKPQH
ncbi:MAG TPA: DUF6600 domain-containing protein [Rhizomicrobium sp.]|nr:DUF6600 domain-containing protein [Rhizomicrobium sp.]